MPATETTALEVGAREPSGSRAVRRLRREGKIPGVVYGGGQDPVAFEVDARVLRQALARAGAVLNLVVDGGDGSPVVVKELTKHPVSGETMHVDLLRVRLDRVIEATVALELLGADDAPGVREGGVLEQITREVTVEALPNDIPDSIEHDASGLQIGDTVTLSAVTAPANVTLVGDPETLIATLTPPRLQTEAGDEIEEEVGLVAEGAPAGEAAASQGDGDAGGE